MAHVYWHTCEGRKAGPKAIAPRNLAAKDGQDLLKTTGPDECPERYMELLAAKFEADSGEEFPKGLLHQQVENGTYQFRIVGKVIPQYAVWFYVQADHMLHVTAMLSLSKENHLSDMSPILDLLAVQENCRGVVFETRRPGMVRQAMRQGFKQTAVVMRKEWA